MARAILVGFLGVIVVFSSAYSFEYEHLYSFPQPYTIGMGKAVTAVDGLGLVSSLANPACVSSEFSIELLALYLGINSWTGKVVEDISELSSAGQDEVVAYAIDMIGKPINFGVGLGGISLDIPIWDISLRLGTKVDFLTYVEFHNPLSSAGFLDFVGLVVSGWYVGGGFSFKNFSSDSPEFDKWIRNLNVGVNLKLVSSGGIVRNFPIDDLILNKVNISVEEISSNLQIRRFVPDIGVLYKIPLDGKNGEYQRVNVGIALKDIGGIVIVLEGREITLVPTTLNLGVAYFISLFPELPFLNKNYVSLDFHDLFFQRKDKDFFKRLHLGLSSELIDLGFFSVNLGVGLNGGYPTFGLLAKVLIAKLSYSIYAEELGVYAGQDPDLRHSLCVSISW